MTKEKLIKLRCKAWGITEAEYYCNQCSDFSLEDMSRAYRRGKNKGRADIAKENAELEKACEETQELLDKQIAVTYKLVEENAELRTKTTALENANRAMVKELDDMTSGGVSVLENVVRSKEQLTKAKELIKNLLDVAKFYNKQRDRGAIMDITPIYDAEQFLKEAEK